MINTSHIALYTAAFFITLTCMVFTLIQRRWDKVQTKIFLGVGLIVGLNCVCCIATAVCNPFALENPTAFLLLKVFQFFYFFVHGALAPLFAYYVVCVTGIAKTYKRSEHNLVGLPFLIMELFIALNPFTNWIYYYDAEMMFHRNWGEYIMYVVAVAYFFFAVANLFHSWNALTRKRRFAFIYFIFITMLGVIIQLLWREIKSELFGESLALLGVMITIENEDDRLDSETGVYNRKALRMDLRSYMANKQHFFVICIKVTNADIVQRMTGSVNAELFSRSAAAYICSIVPRYCVYRTGSSVMVIVLPNTDGERVRALSEEISERYEETWRYNDSEILLNAVISVAEIPLDLPNTDDIFYLADRPIPPNNVKKILSGRDLDYLMRRAAVESAVHRGLEQHNFEVYYQPTYYLEGLRLHGAEALIRLRDPELGNVFPDEFIPIAEQIGLIDDIDDFVLAEVCAFLKSGIPAQMKMDVLNVNLSVLQCMRPGFVDRILSIVDKSGADRSMINFEITESMAASDYKVLSSVVKQLKENGFMFAMDDYGTGYSNMQSIFSLDFDVVKIDKSILWGAEKSELGQIILENSVRMIKQMGRKILVEGVETREQIDLLAKLSVDYLQGYYFSRPIPKKDFIELISRKK